MTYLIQNVPPFGSVPPAGRKTPIKHCQLEECDKVTTGSNRFTCLACNKVREILLALNV